MTSNDEPLAMVVTVLVVPSAEGLPACRVPLLATRIVPLNELAPFKASRLLVPNCEIAPEPLMVPATTILLVRSKISVPLTAIEPVPTLPLVS